MNRFHLHRFRPHQSSRLILAYRYLCFSQCVLLSLAVLAFPFGSPWLVASVSLNSCMLASFGSCTSSSFVDSYPWDSYPFPAYQAVASACPSIVASRAAFVEAYQVIVAS